MENLQTIKTADPRLQLAAGLIARRTDRRLIVKYVSGEKIKVGIFNGVAGGGHDYKSAAVAEAAKRAAAVKPWPPSVKFYPKSGSLKIVLNEL